MMMPPSMQSDPVTSKLCLTVRECTAGPDTWVSVILRPTTSRISEIGSKALCRTVALAGCLHAAGHRQHRTPHLTQDK